MDTIEMQEAEAMLWDWMEKVLEPHFGRKVGPNDIFPFLDENSCLLLPPGIDGIFVIVSLEGSC